MAKLIGQGRWIGSKYLTHEFDISEVDYFEIYHETYQYGNKLKAVLKEEVKGVNPKYGHGWDILGKNNKQRSKIMKQVYKEGKIVKRAGSFNGSYTPTWNVKILKIRGE